jgi:hypothetical protein
MFGMVEMVGVYQVMCFVMLKSAKDRVIGVDTLGQRVPLRVRYGTVCLLIRDVVGSVSCSDEWKFGVVTRPGSHGEEGPWYRDYPRNHSNAMVLCTSLAKHSIRSIVNLCNGM